MASQRAHAERLPAARTGAHAHSPAAAPSSPASLSAVMRRATADPGSLTRADARVLQRTIGNGAVRQLMTQAAPRESRTGLPDGVKARVENLSGLAMDDVRVHYNSTRPAQVQAHAYTQGTDIHVAPGQERHLPHEAWHVVQQKQGRVAPTLQMKGVAINDDSTLEREADAMGRLADREPANGSPATAIPETGRAPFAGTVHGNVVQRASVQTLGGEFKSTKYEAFNSSDERETVFGADMWLDFMPNDFVKKGTYKKKNNADMIGLVQTVKTLKTSAENKGDVPKISHTPEDSPSKKGYKLTAGDVGRGIDKRDTSQYSGTTNTNPLYASDNGKNYSTKLSDSTDQPGLGEHWRASKPDRPAKLIDRPRAALEFAEQAWRQTFEVASLIVEGNLAGTYLGSIEWGVEKAAGKSAEVNPSEIRLVRVGVPSSGFMQAAAAWNTYNGGKRDLTPDEELATGQKTVDVVKLPVTGAGAYSHHLMTDNPDILVIYLAQAVNGFLRSLAATPEEKANTEFNISAMEHRLIALKGGAEFEQTFPQYLNKELASFEPRVREKIASDLEMIFL